ncbi:hypothetical protein [Paracoccus sp. (in: a-proteobacteria)]|uniref:hypothetical protein n=1 Tax=Paracoccus sp. TaxID=267 RepID=UPI003A882C01
MARKISRIAAILTALACGAGTPVQAQEILFNTFAAHNHPWNADVLFPWFEDVTEATGGRVTFNVPPASLAAPPDQYKGVVRGVFDGGFTNLVFIRNLAELVQISSLPLGTFSARGNSRALWETYQEYFAGAGEFDDVELVALYVGLPGDIMLRSAALDIGDNFRGIKTYATPGAAAQLFDGVGAAVVSAPGVQAYEVISSGAVDAYAGLALYDFEAFNVFQYAEKAIMVPGGLSAPSFALFINKDRWAEISEADQQTIMQMAQSHLVPNVGAFDDYARQSQDHARDRGIEITQASDALTGAFRPHAGKLDEAWIARAEARGVDGRAALQFYRDRARQYAAELYGGN